MNEQFENWWNNLSPLEQAKYKLALVTIYLDSIDEILQFSGIIKDTCIKISNTAARYKKIMKHLEAITDKIEKAGISKNFILKYAFGNQSMEKLDEYNEDVLRAGLLVIKDKFFLKDEV